MTALRDRLLLAMSAALAIGVPVLLLMPGAGARLGSGVPSRTVPPLAQPASPPPSALYRRPLFTAGGKDMAEGEATLPADAPQLIGIVGRIDRDAVALVRSADGATRTLQPGQSADGWQLQALAIDAAFFVRGPQRVRVPLPAGDAAPPAQ
jgi:hypothetical protein